MDKFRSFLPPAIAVIDGQTYVMPNWIPVPSDTTLEEAYAAWECTQKTPEKSPRQEYLVEGSKGAIYKVVSQDGKWTCTCSGFGFRKSCKHVTDIKNGQK